MADGILLLGLIILVGFIGNFLFNKTKIPESIFLIIIGILLGPVFKVASPDFFLNNATFFISLALVVVIMESGLTLNISRTLKNAPSALIFTILVMISTVALVTAITVIFFHWPLLNGIFLGIIGSGTTTITITYLVEQLSIGKNTKTLLIIESVLNDITLITSASILISLAGSGASGSNFIRILFNDIIFSTLFGLMSAVIWIFLFVEFIHKNKLGYVFTLGQAFLIYSGAGFLGLNGAITVLTFSLFLGNYAELIKKIRVFTRLLKPLRSDISIVRTINLDITFIMRSLFFVFLGIIARPEGFLQSAVATFVIILMATEILARFISANILSFFEPKFKHSIPIITLMIARGFTSTLVAFLSLNSGIKIPNLADIVLLLVISTTIWSILSTIVLQKKLVADKTKVY